MKITQSRNKREGQYSKRQKKCKYHAEAMPAKVIDMLLSRPNFGLRIDWPIFGEPLVAS